MAITSAGSVRIQKPEDVSASLMMNRFRDWLDANKIEPTLFKSGLLTNGETIFELSFGSEGDAALFNSQFG